MKRFVRQRNDQQYDTMVSLIEHSRQHFVHIELYKKLFRRFWQTCDGYQNGKTYQDVLKLFFSNLCKEQISSHRRIGNTNVHSNQN